MIVVAEGQSQKAVIELVAKANSGSGAELPMARLLALKRQLPPPSVRWETQPGTEFLDLLFEIWDSGASVRDIARTLDYSEQAVRNMLSRKRGQSRPWPSREETAALAGALHGVPADPEDETYPAAYRALTGLLRRYALQDLAAAVKMPPAKLKRYTRRPIDDVADERPSLPAWREAQ